MIRVGVFIGAVVAASPVLAHPGMHLHATDNVSLILPGLAVLTVAAGMGLHRWRRARA